VKVKVRFLFILLLINAGVGALFLQVTLFHSIDSEAQYEMRKSQLLTSWQQLITLKGKESQLYSTASEPASPGWNLVSPQDEKLMPYPFEAPTSEIAHTSESAFFSIDTISPIVWFQIAVSQSDQGQFIGFRFEKTQLDGFADLLRSKISITDSPPEVGKRKTDSVSIKLNTLGEQKEMFVQLTDFASTLDSNSEALFNMVSFLLLICSLTITLFIYFWIARPLEKILSSIQTNEHSKLELLTKNKGEIGKLASLVCKFYEQRDELEKEITLRDIAKQTLQQRESKLEEIISERDRLYRDLHDEIIQSLFAVGLKLELLMKTSDLSSVRTGLYDSGRQVDLTIKKLRTYLENKETVLNHSYHFVSELTALVERIDTVVDTKIKLDMVNEQLADIPENVGHELLASTSEALSNAVRHAHMNQILIAVSSGSDYIEIKITDDGIGCDLDTITLGNGLRNIRDRAEELKGTFEVHSSPGKGFNLSIRMPLQKNQHEQY
jgi:signal transduction histidine kinase